jgi:hypothetical protein
MASTRPWPAPPQQVSSWPRHSARYACHGNPRPPRQSRRRLGPQQPPGSPHVFHGRSWCSSPSHSSPGPWPCVEAAASIMPLQRGRRAVGQPAPRKPIRTTMQRRCRAIRSSLKSRPLACPRGSPSRHPQPDFSVLTDRILGQDAEGTAADSRTSQLAAMDSKDFAATVLPANRDSSPARPAAKRGMRPSFAKALGIFPQGLQRARWDLYLQPPAKQESSPRRLPRSER